MIVASCPLPVPERGHAAVKERGERLQFVSCGVGDHEVCGVCVVSGVFKRSHVLKFHQPHKNKAILYLGIS